MNKLFLALLFAFALPAQAPTLVAFTSPSPCNGTGNSEVATFLHSPTGSTVTSSHRMVADTNVDEPLFGALVHSFSTIACTPFPGVCGSNALVLGSEANLIFIQFMVDPIGTPITSSLWRHELEWTMAFDWTITPPTVAWISQWIWAFPSTGCWQTSDLFAAFGMF